MNHRPSLTSLLAALTISVGAAGSFGDESCPIFVLERTKEGLVLKRESIPSGQMRVFLSNEKSGLIDIVFPPGPGQSAGLIRLTDSRTLIARFMNGELRLQVRSEDGSTHEFPTRSPEDLSRYDIRISVTCGDGAKQAFLIIQNSHAAPDAGPVANMFAGRLPFELKKTDYVVQTETYLHQVGTSVYGESPLEHDRWLFARATFGNGESAYWLVDFGATETAVAKDYLPAGSRIDKLSTVEYSSAGKRTLKYAPHGATGAVQTVLGHVDLRDFRFGDLVFGSVDMTVMSELPDLFGRPLAGIIGMDLLRRAEFLSLEFSPENRSQVILRQTSKSIIKNESPVVVPISFMNSHIMLQGQCNGVPLHFLLDTGAPLPLLDQAAADAAGVVGDSSQSRPARGLDDKGSIKLLPGVIHELRLGKNRAENIKCMIGPLPVFDSLRADNQHIALLGNSFLTRFKRVEIDFSEMVIRFEP